MRFTPLLLMMVAMSAGLAGDIPEAPRPTPPPKPPRSPGQSDDPEREPEPDESSAQVDPTTTA